MFRLNPNGPAVFGEYSGPAVFGEYEDRSKIVETVAENGCKARRAL